MNVAVKVRFWIPFTLCACMALLLFGAGVFCLVQFIGSGSIRLQWLAEPGPDLYGGEAIGCLVVVFGTAACAFLCGLVSFREEKPKVLA
jgi:hypothetical protein